MVKFTLGAMAGMLLLALLVEPYGVHAFLPSTIHSKHSSSSSLMVRSYFLSCTLPFTIEQLI